MINHPTTPPIAQISTVMMLMGIGGDTKRFVRNNISTPTTALMASPTNPACDSWAVVNRAKRNNTTAAMTTTMSTSHSMLHYFSRRPDCLPANKRVGGGLPLCTELPRRLIPGNRASGLPSSRKLGFLHEVFAENVPCKLPFVLRSIRPTTSPSPQEQKAVPPS